MKFAKFKTAKNLLLLGITMWVLGSAIYVVNLYSMYGVVNDCGYTPEESSLSCGEPEQRLDELGANRGIGQTIALVGVPMMIGGVYLKNRKKPKK